MFYTSIESPVGRLWISTSDKGITALGWDRFKGNGVESPDHPVLKKAVRQLKEYFNGKRQYFDLPLDVEGTDFQLKCWKALTEIPFGQTISYGEQAKRVGDKKAARAVGSANGKNPVAIVVPCHRVIATGGALGGFGGGLKAKRLLLSLESSQSSLPYA